MAEKTKPTQSRVDAGLVDADHETPMREDMQLLAEERDSSDDEEAEAPTEVVTFAPSSVNNPYVSEEEQEMEMAPVVFGPPAYGSPDPATSSGTLMPLEQMGDTSAISDDYGTQPEAVEEDAEGDVNATKGAVDLAESEGVDLSQVEGTGEDGRVTKADVENHLASQETA